MKAQKAYKLIDHLRYASKKHNYYVDFVPFPYPDDSFADSDRKFQKAFTKKITFIAFALSYYYDSHLFLDDDYFDRDLSPELVGRDLRHEDLDLLASLIEQTITGEYSGFNLLFKKGQKYTLMRIEGDYTVTFYQLTGKKKKIVKSLVDHQGLYLKH